jgi:hypothetical protein
MENDSCMGIELASGVLLRATPDEGVRGYIFVGRDGKSKPPPCLAKNARQGWGTREG